MATVTEGKAPLIVALSSRTLFDLDESNRVFEEEGVEAYRQYQIAREDEPLEPGVAFPLVQKLSRLNAQLPGRIEVILLSRNAADTGLRVFNSIQHHGLAIERAAFCGGESPYRYMEAFGCDLFLSTVAEDVRHALAAGVAAATLLPSKAQSGGDDVLRLAFDGDAVLFSDEAEQVFKREGLEAFRSSERDAAKRPLQGGPFKAFLAAVHRIQQEFSPDACPIRTALVTARSAPAHERVIRTLRAWDIRLDESLFLGGWSKGAFLKAFGADIFFDDQALHCESARDHVAAGHVPHGIANEMSS
ncbi:MAG: 5'-nucleotidase [Gammaproteobacteria bacterium]|jgi:5'-nucleotidase|nr:5'-nucleotidase [Gammaproteobacteria bacterium]